MSYVDAKSPECESKNCPEDITLVIVPRVVDLGGFEVRRALPSSKKCMIGPFIFWDQAGPGEFLRGTGLDVRPHPHIGLSTLTYLFSGNLMHRDTLGSNQKIIPGDVNLMTAGNGIAHSERTPAEDRAAAHKFFGIQCWLALPKSKEEMSPDFKHHSVTTLPYIDEKGMRARIVTGSYQGLQSPVKTVSEALFVDCILNKNAVLNIPAETEERAVYILSGKVRIDNISYPAGDMLVFKPNANVDVVAEEDAHVLLIGGAVLDGERHVWWNFVSSSKERIEQAKRDWIDGKFGKIPDDDKEFIPLPQNK